MQITGLYAYCGMNRLESSRRDDRSRSVVIAGSDTSMLEAKKQDKSGMNFDARTVGHQRIGVDLTAIEGIGSSTGTTILTEIRTDYSRFPTSSAFSAWLDLAPNKRITGGKPLSSHVQPNHNRANQALRLAASALRHSKSALGDVARGLMRRLGTERRMCRCLGSSPGTLHLRHGYQGSGVSLTVHSGS
jgi:hypothetical protein